MTVELTPVGERTRMDLQLALPDRLSEAQVRACPDKGVEAGMTMTIERLVSRLRARAA